MQTITLLVVCLMLTRCGECSGESTPHDLRFRIPLRPGLAGSVPLLVPAGLMSAAAFRLSTALGDVTRERMAASSICLLRDECANDGDMAHGGLPLPDRPGGEPGSSGAAWPVEQPCCCREELSSCAA